MRDPDQVPDFAELAPHLSAELVELALDPSDLVEHGGDLSGRLNELRVNPGKPLIEERDQVAHLGVHLRNRPSRRRRLALDALDPSVNGGADSDTLRLDGAGVTLDLTLIADTVIQNVEIVDLTGSGNNTLTLALADVLAISSSTDTLRVDGNAGDAVNSIGQGWVAGGTVEVFPTVFYQSYTDGAATLLLDPDIVAASTIS